LKRLNLLKTPHLDRIPTPIDIGEASQRRGHQYMEDAEVEAARFSAGGDVTRTIFVGYTRFQIGFNLPYVVVIP
jgi:hypothetical protein